MASLKHAAELTDELGLLVRRLDEEVSTSGADLMTLTALADEVAEFADSLATAFAAIDEDLSQRLAVARPPKRQGQGARKRGGRRSGERRAPARARTPQATKEEEPTKDELLEQAQAAVIPGRSTMSKEELAKAIDSHEQLTKEELLEQARALDIAGRSEMSKQQLLQAIKKEEAVPKDELLERAKKADVEGRSDMSKDELREALQSN